MINSSKKTFYKSFLMFVVTALMLTTASISNIASAQSVSNGYANTNYSNTSTTTDASLGLSGDTISCGSIGLNLGYGVRDHTVGGDITRLQTFLYGNGYITKDSVTGYFGLTTQAAVVKFQSANGISPTGYVGVLTRTKMNSIGCGIAAPPPTIIKTTYPTINSISPSSGPVGTTVTLTGVNFVATNSILFNGQLAVPYATSSGTSITFTVPSYLTANCSANEACPMYAMLVSPGSYGVAVQTQSHDYVTATTTFTVTGPSTSPVSPAHTITLTTPPPSTNNDLLILGINYSATTSAGIVITPTSVDQDTRCPQGLFCFQAGNVVIKTQIKSSTYTKTVDIQSGNSFVTPDGYTVTILNVSPERTQNSNFNTIPTANYQITYQVTNNGSSS